MAMGYGAGAFAERNLVESSFRSRSNSFWIVLAQGIKTVPFFFYECVDEDLLRHAVGVSRVVGGSPVVRV